jgi:RNA polymerase sigma-70 factor (ECF subfamily)
MLRRVPFYRAPGAEPKVSAAADSQRRDPLGPLATAAVAGDRDAQRTLLATLSPSLLRAVRGVLGALHPDVEDVLQEAMTAVHRSLHTFRGQCQVAHFASRVAVQTALSARRYARYRSRYTPVLSPDEVADVACDARSPADARLAAERLQAFRLLLEELPVPQAEALVFHFVLGYSISETAAAQRVPLNTARSRLRNGISRLRDRVQGDQNLLAVLGPNR